MQIGVGVRVVAKIKACVKPPREQADAVLQQDIVVPELFSLTKPIAGMSRATIAASRSSVMRSRVASSFATDPAVGRSSNVTETRRSWLKAATPHNRLNHKVAARVNRPWFI